MLQTILVVEDSLDISRLLEHVLSRAGYRVVVESEGKAGWEAFQRLQPDLVLSDVNLPGLSGIDICERVKQIAPTPVILLTVQAEMESVQRGICAGADAYLAKPFEITELLAAVEDALRPQIRRLSTGAGERGGQEDPNR